MAETFKSLKGKLLLDSGQLNGSFFHRSVVLICQHDPEGAFGLVINRASDNVVGDVLVADLPPALQEHPLFLGGPVQPTMLSYLHTDTYVPHGNVLPNLNLGHSLETLIELGESESSTQKVRIFAGYAGWGAGQLEDELQRKAWVTHPASVKLVFQVKPQSLWRQILRQKEGWRYRLLAEAPDDFSWN